MFESTLTIGTVVIYVVSVSIAGFVRRSLATFQQRIELPCQALLKCFLDDQFDSSTVSG